MVETERYSWPRLPVAQHNSRHPSCWRRLMSRRMEVNWHSTGAPELRLYNLSMLGAFQYFGATSRLLRSIILLQRISSLLVQHAKGERLTGVHTWFAHA